MSNFIYNNEEEAIAVNYYSRVNNTVGAVGIGISFTLLQFDNPTILAWFAFCVFLTWVFTQGYGYRKMLQRCTPAAKPSMFLYFKYGWLSYVSLVSMALIALGIIDKSIAG